MPVVSDASGLAAWTNTALTAYLRSFSDHPGRLGRALLAYAARVDRAEQIGSKAVRDYGPDWTGSSADLMKAGAAADHAWLQHVGGNAATVGQSLISLQAQIDAAKSKIPSPLYEPADPSLTPAQRKIASDQHEHLMYLAQVLDGTAAGTGSATASASTPAPAPTKDASNIEPPPVPGESYTRAPANNDLVRSSPHVNPGGPTPGVGVAAAGGDAGGRVAGVQNADPGKGSTSASFASGSGRHVAANAGSTNPSSGNGSVVSSATSGAGDGGYQSGVHGGGGFVGVPGQDNLAGGRAGGYRGGVNAGGLGDGEGYGTGRGRANGGGRGAGVPGGGDERLASGRRSASAARGAGAGAVEERGGMPMMSGGGAGGRRGDDEYEDDEQQRWRRDHIGLSSEDWMEIADDGTPVPVPVLGLQPGQQVYVHGTDDMGEELRRRLSGPDHMQGVDETHYTPIDEPYDPKDDPVEQRLIQEREEWLERRRREGGIT